MFAEIQTLHFHGCLKFPVRFCNKVPLILSGQHMTEHAKSVPVLCLGPGWGGRGRGVAQWDSSTQKHRLLSASLTTPCSHVLADTLCTFLHRRQRCSSVRPRVRSLVLTDEAKNKKKTMVSKTLDVIDVNLRKPTSKVGTIPLSQCVADAVSLIFSKD